LNAITGVFKEKWAKVAAQKTMHLETVAVVGSSASAL